MPDTAHPYMLRPVIPIVVYIDNLSYMDKLYPVTDKLIMGVTGDPGDATQMTEYVAKTIKLYQIKNGYQPSINAAKNLARNTLLDAWKSASAPCLNMLLVGYDDECGGKLYYIDALATCVELPYAAHGISGVFTISLLEHYYNPSMTEMEAYEVLQKCVQEMHHRWFLNLGNFQVKVVSANGIFTLPTIKV